MAPLKHGPWLQIYSSFLLCMCLRVCVSRFFSVLRVCVLSCSSFLCFWKFLLFLFLRFCIQCLCVSVVWCLCFLFRFFGFVGFALFCAFVCVCVCVCLSLSCGASKRLQTLSFALFCAFVCVCVCVCLSLLVARADGLKLHPSSNGRDHLRCIATGVCKRCSSRFRQSRPC